MRPHPRIRKTVKWGGCVVAGLLTAVWLLSGWFDIELRCSRAFEGSIHSGRLCVWEAPSSLGWAPWMRWRLRTWVRSSAGSVFQSGSLHYELKWTLERDVAPWGIPAGRPGTLLYIPLWPAPVIAAVVWALVWAAGAPMRRRARLGRCLRCGYDRAGIESSALCPECGSPASASSPAAS